MMVVGKEIHFTVVGKPQQRGSKQANVRYDRSGKPITKDGRILTFAKDDNDKSKEWMNLVRDKAVECMNGVPMMEGPVMLTAKFYFLRPAGHFGTGKNAGIIKDSAPLNYCGTPDLSKLLRCVEDGLSQLVYRDDRQIFTYGHQTGKYWTTETPRVEVVVTEFVKGTHSPVP